MAVSAIAIGACGGGDDTIGSTDQLLSIEELKDPETCKDCHPRHYAEWSTSMHAYAAEDPVFLAMNAQGQEETGEELGDFCVSCHAPLAVVDGDTTNGMNMDEVPKHKQGVTCYFCHNVVDVQGTHNNPLVLAQDQTMRGGITDPVDPGVHNAEFSTLQPGGHADSAKLCGACHDIVNGNDVHLERTFQEWKDSVFSKGTFFNTCTGCHMRSRRGVAARAEGLIVPQRDHHEHLWPAVDMALTEFPGTEIQREAIDCVLGPAVVAELRPEPGGNFLLLLESNPGHRFPSGAMQDRRAWVEFIAYDADDVIVYSSGDIADDEIVDKHVDDEGYDPNLWVFRDWLYDEDGSPTHKFWEAAKSDAHPDGYETSFMPAAEQLGTRHTVQRRYNMGFLPERVTVRVRLRPMGLGVLDELIEDGYLEPEIRDHMQTLDVAATRLEWRREDGYDAVKKTREPPPDCSYDSTVEAFVDAQ
jgi:hypothetical protein